MAETAPIRVDVVSDVVCPWCYIGQKRLARAIEMLPDIDVDVHWRPYQLDGAIPPEGVERKAYMTQKFGSKERLDQAHETVRRAASGDGIEFRFEDIKVSPNTLDAHRLIRWAGSSDHDTQGRLVRRLFGAFFEEGRDIGDRTVLLDVARDAGLDPAIAESLLAGDADRLAVIEEIETAQQMGVTGVPCFLLEGRYAVMGAQDAGALADAIRQVSGLKARGEIPAAE